MKQIELKALAKINLGLDVLGRRENGYHDVRMIMQSVYLYDDVVIVRKDLPGIEVETNLHFLPTDENNIAYKAAAMLMEEFKLPGGVRIVLNKQNPSSLMEMTAVMMESARNGMWKATPQQLKDIAKLCLVVRSVEV